MRFKSLPEWLDWQQTLHFTDVDLGLTRIGLVWQRLNRNNPLNCKVVTVAGTNGKGSSIAILEAILKAEGYRVGCYTSPHIVRYNERIKVDGNCCSDQQICQVFSEIDRARKELSLTYFEFATLAALLIFSRENIDVALLEVGMGGRLDAVNIIDCDIALITQISLDHTQWLGNDIETIAAEKAGIIRANRPVVCSESFPANAILNQADKLQAPTYIAERDYRYSDNEDSWTWTDGELTLSELPFPNLVGDYQRINAAGVLKVISLLIKEGMKVSNEAIFWGLNHIELAGRFQVLPGDVEVILDVTHNHQGADNLHQLLATQPVSGRTLLVLGMLADKDVEALCKILSPVVSQWYLASLCSYRGLSAKDLAKRITGIVDASKCMCFDSVQQAYDNAFSEARGGDRILVCGSFHTVGEVTKKLALA